MHRRYIETLLVLLVFLAGEARGHIPPDSGLLRMLRREEAFIQQTFAAGKCWMLRYRMDSEVYMGKGGALKSQRSEGTLMASSLVRMTSSAESEVIMDSLYTYSIFKAGKSIMKSRTPRGVFKAAYNAHLSAMQEQLLRQMEITSYKSLPASGSSGAQWLLELRPSDTVRHPAYERMTVWVDARTWELLQMKVLIHPGVHEKIRSYTLTVLEKKAVGIPGWWADIRRYIFDHQGKLKKEYSDYEYKDFSD